jgi:hypothetical protein
MVHHIIAALEHMFPKPLPKRAIYRKEDNKKRLPLRKGAALWKKIT